MDGKEELKGQNREGTVGIRNRIVIVVGILLFLLLATGIAGVLETDSLITFSTESTTVAEGLAEARKQTRQIIVTFQTEVHEWKNVLLRGQNKANFDKYLGDFTKRHLQTVDLANSAQKAYAAANIDISPIKEFIDGHEKYYEKCFKGGTEAAKSDPLWFANVDDSVRGMDRPLTEILDNAAIKLGKDYDTLVKNNATLGKNIGLRAKVISYVAVVLGIFVGVASFPFLIANVNTIIGGIRNALTEAERQRREAERQRVETDKLRSKTDEEYRALQNNIVALLKTVSDASDGNLSVRAKVTEGALGNVADAFNQMLEAFGELVTDIQKLANNTLAMADEIGASSEQLAAGAASQAAELVNANQSVTSMGQSLQKVSENAETAALAARRTQASALQGSNSAQNVVKGMETLRQNVQAGAKKIKNLGDRSMEITGIVGAIAKISDQTNMLALNAAIEAARAGEHGRGFSVVADEVRKLAERTATATQEIERLVKDIQTETNESVAAIEQQTQVVEEQAGVVTDAGESLLKIQQAGTESAELIGDISNSSIKQVQGASVLVMTMQRVSEIAQSTRDRVEKTVKSARDLAGLASNLNRTVAKFKL